MVVPAEEIKIRHEEIQFTAIVNVYNGINM
jgi:hypothetical protein